MSKIQRIEDLEREVDQLHVVLGRLSDRLAVLENAPGPVKVPTLPEQVRREFHAKWDWLLEAVGL